MELLLCLLSLMLGEPSGCPAMPREEAGRLQYCASRDCSCFLSLRGRHLSQGKRVKIERLSGGQHSPRGLVTVEVRPVETLGTAGVPAQFITILLVRYGATSGSTEI